MRLYQIFLFSTVLLIAAFPISNLTSEVSDSENFTVNNFSVSSETSNGTGHVFYLEKNLSRDEVSSNAKILDLDTDEEMELKSVVRQFSYQKDEVVKTEKWHSSLNYRTDRYLKKYDYFRFRDRYYKISRKEPSSIGSSVELNGTLLDNHVEINNPAVIQLELDTNSSRIRLTNGPTLPLGVLKAQSMDKEFYLWSDIYSESTALGVQDEKITGWNSTALSREYSIEEPLKVNYSINAEKVKKPGKYRAEDSLWFETEISTGVLIYSVSFELRPQ